MQWAIMSFNSMVNPRGCTIGTDFPVEDTASSKHKYSFHIGVICCAFKFRESHTLFCVHLFLLA